MHKSLKQLDEGIPGGDYQGSQRAAFAYSRQPTSPDTPYAPELLAPDDAPLSPELSSVKIMPLRRKLTEQ